MCLNQPPTSNQSILNWNRANISSVSSASLNAVFHTLTLSIHPSGSGASVVHLSKHSVPMDREVSEIELQRSHHLVSIPDASSLDTYQMQSPDLCILSVEYLHPSPL